MQSAPKVSIYHESKEEPDGTEKSLAVQGYHILELEVGQIRERRKRGKRTQKNGYRLKERIVERESS